MAKSKTKAKKSGTSLLGKLLSFVAWLTGVIVSLAVGFGLVDGVLNLNSLIPRSTGFTIFFGWIIVVSVLLGIVLAIFKQFFKKDLGKGALFGQLLSFVAWLTGVVVSLAVGFAMVGKDGIPVLKILLIPDVITIFFGWVIVVTTLLGVLLAILKQFE